MITGIGSLIQREAVYESTPGLTQRRDEKIDVKIRFPFRIITHTIRNYTEEGGGGEDSQSCNSIVSVGGFALAVKRE